MKLYKGEDKMDKALKIKERIISDIDEIKMVKDRITNKALIEKYDYVTHTLMVLLNDVEKIIEE